MLTRLPGSWGTMSMMRWFFFKPNLSSPDTRRLFELVSRQMVLGVKQFRMGKMVLPTRFNDEELKSLKLPTLLLIGREESLYDSTAGLRRAVNLIPGIEAELVANASHDLPVGQATAVNNRVVAFLGD
jgi:pimeloyl-ACP methyl ester carboxylesterase